MRARAPVPVAFGLLLAACGGGSGKLPDGPPGPDAARPDAEAPTMASIHVTQEVYDPEPGAPIEGARVQVIAPGGAAVDYTTDATGNVTFPCEPGSRVWVGRDAIEPTLPTFVPGGGPGSGQLYLLASLDPGTHVELGAPPSSGSANGTLTVTYQPYQGGETGVYRDGYVYQGNTMCFDGGVETAPGTVVYTTYAGCALDARELVFTAYDVATGAPLAWLRVPNFAANPGALDATAATWDEAGTTYHFAPTNLPAEVIGVSSYVVSPGSWHSLYQSGAVDVPYQVTGAALPSPMYVVSELLAETAQPQWIADPVVGAFPASYAVDGSALLPFVSSPTFDPPTRTITWTATAGAAIAPQLVTASFSYYDNADLTQYRWTIYAPGDTTELVIPDVPAAVTTHDLQAGDIVYPDLWLVAVDTADYDYVVSGIDVFRDDLSHKFQPTMRGYVSGGYLSK